MPTIDGMMQFHYCLPSATSKVKTGTSDATPNRARYGKSKPQNMFTRPKKQNGCGPTLQVRFTSPKKVEEVKNASPKETPTYGKFFFFLGQIQMTRLKLVFQCYVCN